MKILIIEDDTTLLASLRDLLIKNNFSVSSYTSIEDIDDFLELNSYDLVILDLMLGEYNGLDFLKVIREEIFIPIIILTAKDSKEDILRGFSLGADDYITKPFDNDILIARINCKLKNISDHIVFYGETKFDINIGTVSFNENLIDLTSCEMEILKFLISRKGSFVSKCEFLDISYFIHEDSTERTIISHIYNIRKKIQEIGGDDPIENKWGVGYRWKEQ